MKTPEASVTEPAITTYLFEGFSLRVAGPEIRLSSAGHSIQLNLAESNILKELVANAGQSIKKDRLIELISPNDVHKVIHDLRRILHDTRKDERLIKTESKAYTFVAPVRIVHDENATGASTKQTTTAVAEDYLDGAEPATQSKDERSSDRVRSGSIPRVSGHEDTFEEWMGGRGRIVTMALFAFVILTSTVSIWLYSSPNLTNQAKPFACLAQAFVILIAFAHSLLKPGPRGFGSDGRFKEKAIKDAGYENLRDLRSDSEKIRRALTRYANYWRWLLISWLSLYVFLAVLGFQGLDLSTLIANADPEVQRLGIRLSLFNTLLNNWNTGMLFLCFYVLNKQMKDESEKRNLAGTPFIGFAFFLLIVLTVFEFMSVADISKPFISKAASLASGIAGAIAMALLVGRLQSKFLGPRLWLLIALYSYTAIQPLFLYLEKNDIWAVVLIDFALTLKCLLYLYTAWLFQSGDLLFYFARVRRIYRTVPQQRQAFRDLLDGVR
jgi:DNA-binding winged helix-turn-helix (wHTH) protein